MSDTSRATINKLKNSIQDNSLTARKVSKRLQHGPVRKAGRKYNANFEQHVLDELVFTTIENVNGRSQASIVANFCYSHELTMQAAKKVQVREEFSHDKLVVVLLTLILSEHGFVTVKLY